jgi:hypothetical protein
MAFNTEGLNLVSGSKRGKAPQIFAYRTNDLVTAVDGAGYFDNGNTTNTGMRNSMNVGDLVYVHANAAGTTPTFGLLIVTANSAGVIDVTNATALGTIDSD